jgi:uroporphyrinogen III methyltransferase/synthase
MPDTAPAQSGGPLEGRRVLVTRARHQAAALAEPLAALGAEVLIAPVIATADPDDWGPVDAAIANLASYDWIVLTSTNAVERFASRMGERGVPVTELASARVAVVGSATAQRLLDYGISAALVPDDFRAEGLVEAFVALGAGPGWRVLLPRAASARELLPDALREAGASVDVVPVYRTVPAQPDPVVIGHLGAGDVDVVTFTSPSTARHFVAWAQAAGLGAESTIHRITAASIGPVTTEALRSLGYRVVIEAAPSTMAGLVEAILEHYSTA